MTRIPRWFGYNPPFIGGQQGVLSRQEDLRLVKNDVLQLILTNPGERVHRPTFGSPLRSTVFEQNDDITFNTLLSEIANVIRREEPRLANIRVSGTQDRDNNKITLRIDAFLTQDPNVAFELDTEVQFRSQTITTQDTSSGNGVTTRNTGPLSGRQ